MKKLLSLILSAILLILCLSSCAENQRSTYYTRSSRNENGRLAVSFSRESKEGKILADDELRSVYEEALKILESSLDFLSCKDKSLLSGVNASVDMVFDVDKKLIAEIENAFKLSEKCDRLYEPAGGALTSLLSSKTAPEKDALANALTHMGADKLEISETTVKKLDPNVKLDFGAYRDGYAIGKVCDFLADSDIAYGTVTFNGIAGVFGTKPDNEPFTIELGDGDHGIFNITDGYIALVSADFGTSYDYKDGVLAPIIDKATVYSADPCTAAVIASIGYAYGPDAILSLYEKEELIFEAVLTDHDRSEILTEKLKEGSMYAPATKAAESK